MTVNIDEVRWLERPPFVTIGLRIALLGGIESILSQLNYFEKLPRD